MTVLFFLQLKRALKAVPKLIAGAVIPLFLAGMAVFWAKEMHTKNTGTVTAPVALVNYDSESYLELILPLITETEAANSFSFLEMDEAQAMDALRTGSVCAVLVLPKEMFSGILDSTNIPALLYLPGGDSFPSLLVSKYAEAGALTLGAAQAAIYAATDLYREYGLTGHLSDIYYDINVANLNYAIARESVFSAKSTTATGELSPMAYYGCTLFLCLLLFLGAGMGSFLCTPAPMTFYRQLRRNGINMFMLEASRFLPFVLFYLFFVFALGGLALILFPDLSLSASAVLFLICTALCFSACTQLVFSLFRNAGQGLLAFTFSGLFMILFAGGFLPYAFLPDFFSGLTPFLPFSACLKGLRRLAAASLAPKDSFILLIHTALALFLLAVCSLIRGKEVDT
ncbi:MAG: ABC transporter permease [Lachnospiraceae bacterium]|nr:ABC transporter permease [Lachnospiraceae bacterium]